MTVGERFDQSDFGASAGRAAPAVLDLIIGFNSSAVDLAYLQLFDATEQPADDTVPVRAWPVGPLASFSYAPSQSGRKFDPGLWWAISSTPDTLTPVPAALWWVTLEGRDT